MFYTMLKRAKASKKDLVKLEISVKNRILKEMSKDILKHMNLILEANLKDMAFAKENNLDRISLERLYVDEKTIANISKTILDISKLEEPLDRVLESWVNKDALEITKVSVPIGVIAIIYESRPNVTADTVALCFKSGNVCILKGGKEANYTNLAIVKVLQNVLEKNSLPKEIISFLNHGSRSDIAKLIKERDYIDLIIPRGGEGLNKYISENASVPVIEHGKGLCHLYVHSDADYSKVIELVLNSKCQNPSVCNAMETLLIDSDIAQQLLPILYKKFQQTNTQLKGCDITQTIVNISDAKKEDFYTEYLDNILNIKIVKDINEAIEHISIYGSGHTETIVTENVLASEQFMNEVDASCLYLNVSTKYTDGETFGFGSAVGISTSKLHARGPVGIKELTTYKYKIYGNGQLKVSWQGSFGYIGFFSMIILGSVLSFIPMTLFFVPIGYLSALYEVPFFMVLIIGIILMVLLFEKRDDFKIMKKLFLKYPKISDLISSKILGLQRFSSLPSALAKIPKRAFRLFKLLNVSFWVLTSTSIGYLLAQ